MNYNDFMTFCENNKSFHEFILNVHSKLDWGELLKHFMLNWEGGSTIHVLSDGTINITPKGEYLSDSAELTECDKDILYDNTWVLIDPSKYGLPNEAKYCWGFRL